MKTAPGALFRRIAIAATLAIGATAGSAGAQTIRTETGTTSSTIIPQLIAKTVARSGIKVLINSNQTLARSALNLGSGAIEMAVVPPTAYVDMTEGSGFFKAMGDKAKDAAKDIRSLFSFVIPTFHIIVWADGPIKSWKDIKGKRVFVGPPGGAAIEQTSGLVRIATGYEPRKDYKPVALGWGAAGQAFQDGQFDVFIMPQPIGSAMIEQIGLLRRIRMFSLTEEEFKSDAFRAYLEKTTTVPSVIPTGVYEGQVNNDKPMRTSAAPLVLAVRADMSEETAYQLTKAFWENVDEFKKNVAILKHLPTDNPMLGNPIPLHPGAARYYKEAGIKIPAR